MLNETSPWDSIQYAKNDHVATLTLNRPETRNAIDSVMRFDAQQAKAMGQGIARSTEFHLDIAKRLREKQPLLFKGL